uniref:ATP-dependent DNA helicase n=1 Tax=Fagus sylvatica TaxID=28930 RepID=A0A2N9HBD5_FAGSY
MNRSSKHNGIDKDVLQALVQMLDENNILVQSFRMARDRFQGSQVRDFKLRLIGTRSTDGREHNLPSASEIAAIIIGDFDPESGYRDIIVESKEGHLKRINELHPSFMPMQYPLLFPYGEDGFRLGILYREIDGRKKTKRTSVTMREYYAYRLQERESEGKTLHHGRRLFQQFVVDSYTCVEQSRLRYFRDKQKQLRSEVYHGLKDAVFRGDTTPASIGKRIVLPSSFTGGPRYMIQCYQDAMAICRWFGYPDLFITFTCNSKWPEIESFLSMHPGLKVEDRPDIVARVFKIKLNNLMHDLKRGSHFGRVLAEAYEAVSQFMIHGPCGAANTNSPCMIENKCKKHFPKKIYAETTIDEDGFPVYRRRDDGRTVEKNGIKLDNRFVVPYNKELLIKYQAHINVEWCNRSRSIKYLFKYINKGPDRGTFVLQENSDADPRSNSTQITEIDEIKTYLDCRYVSAIEACWRIFEFEIQYRDPSVERLGFHLEDEHNVVFTDSDYLDNVIDRPDVDKTMFTQWFKANEMYDSARQLTYSEFPSKWVWHKNISEWSPRKSGRSIGRIYYAHPGSGERFYLRMLLNVVKGPRTFEEIRTINNIIHPTFRAACYALGLLDDDKEWHEAIRQASLWATGKQLRELFTTILLFCEVSDPYNLWVSNWEILSDDILHRQRRILQYEELRLSNEQIQNYTLEEIENNMVRNGRSLKEFEMMPYPDMMRLRESNNRLIVEELNYDKLGEAEEHARIVQGLNTDQRNIYDEVRKSVTCNNGGFYFVYGHGGTGKTYLWKALITWIRSEGKIVLAVASSGIAALLLPGGRTAHSRFQIPIKVGDESTCSIKQGTHAAELMSKVSLIIWDEAPMAHRNCFEAVDRSLRDLLRFTDPTSLDKPFGGKTVVLGGDFRQILPVIPKGRREDIVESSINQSLLWDYCTVFKLTQNMRIQQNRGDKPTRDFAEWILKVGDDTIANADGNSIIEIPKDLLVPGELDPIKDIVEATYPNLLESYMDGSYLQERAILAPTNDIVQELNEYIIDLIDSPEATYLSADSICKASSNIEHQDALYPVEFLNSLKFAGIPNHELKLKIGLPIMLLRNLNQSAGLCNGTRLTITQMSRWVIEARIITGTHVGCKVIPLFKEMSYNTLKQISTDKDTWIIKVRIARMWDAINTNTNQLISIDMILVDEEGCSASSTPLDFYSSQLGRGFSTEGALHHQLPWIFIPLNWGEDFRLRYPLYSASVTLHGGAMVSFKFEALYSEAQDWLYSTAK